MTFFTNIILLIISYSVFFGDYEKFDKLVNPPPLDYWEQIAHDAQMATVETLYPTLSDKINAYKTMLGEDKAERYVVKRLLYVIAVSFAFIPSTIRTYFYTRWMWRDTEISRKRLPCVHCFQMVWSCIILILLALMARVYDNENHELFTLWCVSYGIDVMMCAVLIWISKRYVNEMDEYSKALEDGRVEGLLK